MSDIKVQAIVEAILFASGDPLEVARIAEALDTDIETAVLELEKFAASLEERQSGLCLLRLDDKYQLCTKTEYADKIRTILEIRRNTPLSSAALEVLAVVAYNQPITKSYIEQVRGVDCSGVISTLCQKGLIEECGRLELPGRPLLYATTPDFLRCFCISSLSELPDLPNKDNADENDVNEEKDEANEFTQEQISFIP